jgi:hypothetical protein
VVDILTSQESKALLELCRTGRLYDLEKWIAAGKSLRLPAESKKTVLLIALETGFHSLVELVVRNEPNQALRNAALRYAVTRAHLDFVQLLLAHGADLKSVPLADVLFTWNPRLIRFFLAQGADPISGAPFAQAFGAKIRTAIGPFLECKRARPELADQLQEQADCALRHFCGEGNLKWVSLLMWAGADPRTKGPVLGKDYTNDPECFTTALEEACFAENVDVLKKVKPALGRDDMTPLIHHAALLARKDTLEYLLELGANPNDKLNGGSSTLDAALSGLSFARFDPYGGKRLKSKYDVSTALDCVRELLAHGAIWSADDTYHVSSLRRALLECEPSVTIELLQLFRKHNACAAERVHRLLGTPRMREHLKSATGALLRLRIHLEALPKLRRQKTA